MDDAIHQRSIMGRLLVVDQTNVRQSNIFPIILVIKYKLSEIYLLPISFGEIRFLFYHMFILCKLIYVYIINSYDTRTYRYIDIVSLKYIIGSLMSCKWYLM